MRSFFLLRSIPRIVIMLFLSQKVEERKTSVRTGIALNVMTKFSFNIFFSYHDHLDSFMRVFEIMRIPEFCFYSFQKCRFQLRFGNSVDVYFYLTALITKIIAVQIYLIAYFTWTIGMRGYCFRQHSNTSFWRLKRSTTKWWSASTIINWIFERCD